VTARSSSSNGHALPLKLGIIQVAACCVASRLDVFLLEARGIISSGEVYTRVRLLPDIVSTSLSFRGKMKSSNHKKLIFNDLFSFSLAPLHTSLQIVFYEHILGRSTDRVLGRASIAWQHRTTNTELLQTARWYALEVSDQAPLSSPIENPEGRTLWRRHESRQAVRNNSSGNRIFENEVAESRQLSNDISRDAAVPAMDGVRCVGVLLLPHELELFSRAQFPASNFAAGIVKISITHSPGQLQVHIIEADHLCCIEPCRPYVEVFLLDSPSSTRRTSHVSNSTSPFFNTTLSLPLISSDAQTIYLGVHQRHKVGSAVIGECFIDLPYSSGPVWHVLRAKTGPILLTTPTQWSVHARNKLAGRLLWEDLFFAPSLTIFPPPVIRSPSQWPPRFFEHPEGFVMFESGALFPFSALSLGMILVGVVYSTHFNELRVLIVEARALPLEPLSFPPDMDFMIISLPRWSPHHIAFRGFNPTLNQPLIFKCSQSELVDLSLSISVKNRDRLVAQWNMSLTKLSVDVDIAETLCWHNFGPPIPRTPEDPLLSPTVTMHSGEEPSPKNDGLELWALQRQAGKLEAFELSQALQAKTESEHESTLFF